MNFSKTASYSVRILSHMATHEGISMSALVLHDELSIPYPYLRQVLKALSRSGFIISTKGRNGGYRFRREPAEISLAEIIDSTDGLEKIDKCILGFDSCPFDKVCPMHNLWEETRKGMMKVLRETSLGDLISKKS